MNELKILLIALILFAILPVSSAKVTVSISHTPSTILPGDEVEYTMIITNYGQEVKINSIRLVAEGVKVEPASFSNVGTIAAHSSIQVQFVVKTKNEGIHTIEIYIFTANETVKRLILVNVENKLPDLILTSSLNINEVNTVSFFLTNPIGSINSVTVEALFDAEPKIIYLGDLTSSGRGTFRYLPRSEDELSFKISFYNGMNRHELVKTVKPEYRQSRGIIVNVSVPYSSISVLDVIPVEVTVSNLRNDTIYSLKVKASLSGAEEEKSEEIGFLRSLTSSKASFKFSPDTPGKNKIIVRVSYEDSLNNRYSAEKDVEIMVFDEKAISVTNIETEKSFEEITITGDVSNSGRSTAYNVLLTMQLGDKIKTFYIGSIDSSDFDSFEFTFKNANESRAVLTVSWNNELGDKVEITKEIQISEEIHGEIEEGSNLLLVGSAIAAVIIAIVAIIWIKSGK